MTDVTPVNKFLAIDEFVQGYVDIARRAADKLYPDKTDAEREKMAVQVNQRQS